MAEVPDAAGRVDLVRERLDPRTLLLTALVVIAALYTLRVARELLIPIAVALLLNFLLSPAVRALRRLRIPEPVGAALVLLALLSTVSAVSYNLAAPAADWVSRAPETLAEVRAKFAPLRRPVEQMSRAAEQVEDAAAMRGSRTPEVEIAGPTLVKKIFGGTLAMLGFVTVVGFLAFFLLAGGDRFLQKLIRVLPQLRDKKKAVSIAREIESQVSVHMVTTTAINVGVGAATALAVWLCGMPNAPLWGLVAGILNYVPYLGAMATVAVLGMAALVTFDTIGRALLVPGTFVLINLLEAHIVTPLVLGSRLRLNTVALFVGMMFWWYVWGIPGALMAVPMMATIKIICDHFEELSPLAEFLGT